MVEMMASILKGGPILVAIVFMFMMWMKDKKRDSSDFSNKMIAGKIDRMRHEVNHIKDSNDWLKEVHNQKDSDGVYAWYVRKSLEDSVKELASTINQLSVFMRDIHNQSKQTTVVLEKLVDKIK